MSNIKELLTGRIATSLCAWLFWIFFTLKLTNVINWSWWWVTAPLWIPISISIVLFTVLFIVLFILLLVSFAIATLVRVGLLQKDDIIEAEVIEDKR